MILPAGGEWPSQKRLIKLDGHGLRLSALKKSEEGAGVILRLYEAHGGRGVATLEAKFTAKTARRVNLLEEGLGKVASKSGALEFEFAPYQVVSLEL